MNMVHMKLPLNVQETQSFHQEDSETMLLSSKNVNGNHHDVQKHQEDTYWNLFQMRRDLIGMLTNCTKQRNLGKGCRIHARIHRTGLIERDSYVATAFVNLYAKCGVFVKAHEVLDQLEARNIISWNALISGYYQNGCDEEVIRCFQQLKQEGIFPNEVSFTCALKSCGRIKALSKGKQMHSEIIKQGFLERDILIGTVLIQMYTKCGELTKAQEVFDALPVLDVICWNTMIGGYLNCGHGDAALYCFEQMQHKNVSPNAATFIYALKACGSIGAIDKVKEMHAMILRDDIQDISVCNTLVDMYLRCGSLWEAQEVFDCLQVQDVVCWTALIAGYVEHQHAEKAMCCFEQMKLECVFPNDVTFLSILKACSSGGALQYGKKMHTEILGQVSLIEKPTVGTTLVDMYAKCGMLSTALTVFFELQIQNVVTWTTLIAGYAQLGHDDVAIQLFNKMIAEGIQPDSITFTVILSACSHSGVLDKGQMYFAFMNVNYGLIPTLKHHACMVNLFSRAGHFDKAIAVIEKMSACDHIPVWSSLLGACQKWGNMEIGEFAFEHVVNVNKKNAGAYVLMSNVHKVAQCID